MKLRTILICLFAFPMLCGAQERHIDFTQKLTGINGKPIVVDAQKDSPAMTLGDACVGALESMTQEDQRTTGADKFKRDQLARKIYQNKNAVLTVEETALLKERIGDVYGPAVVGAAWPLLDPAIKESK